MSAYSIDPYAKRIPLTERTRALLAAHVTWERQGQGIGVCDGDTGMDHGPHLMRPEQDS